MDILLNYLVLILAAGFTGLYVVNCILNVVRANKVKELLKNNTLGVDGTVTKIIVSKKKTFVKVKFTSPTSKMLFETLFEYFSDEWNDRAKVGDSIKVIYPDVTNLKKVYAFPIFLEGDKVKMPAGGFVTDLMLVLFSGYVFVQIITNMKNENAFTTSVKVTDVTPGVLLILYGVMHVLLLTYVLDRLFNAPMHENQHYLELFGNSGTAEVKTFKLVGAKNKRGFKESQMEIEYFNGTGDKINARCASYYYTETQEQFVSILYDPKRPKNVVYIKYPSKEKKNKNK